MHRVTHYRHAAEGIEAISLNSDRAFPRHTHDEFGVGVIASGTQRSWSGRGFVNAQAGDAIMVNPGELHDGAPVGTLSDRAWRMLYLSPTLVNSIAAQEGIDYVELAHPAVHDVRLTVAVDRLFARVVHGAAPLARDEALVMLVTSLLARHTHRLLSHAGPAPEIDMARERLDAAPAAPVTLAELAALSGVSRFQLLRGFAREIGTTPHAYQIQLRTRLARALIARGSPIVDAAAEAGFADQSHLTRAFTRQFGISPGRYALTLRAASGEA
ncbi:MAG: AraC family transcriptional regulator [Paraburkholderia sp.]|uniref:AraC family transcriptional regulator n=1 Tax=Paraburkholderia sp. TaxID=1926495 RepID=UPI0012299401|nr:AraC family transcriptional regulator [Paraburkholderia sp.]TAM02688.1 MAG: AraC family transcriptional regulator [Paraburkholderia sp.]